ncbi:hypothetical protein DFH08DRAFT_951113 [Mycena albidolilacea]|uniref:F-box domain-containing protein n=1 Tax=Mycena albidolilacea TaxID=1033008 RepID=A0AAD7AN48_9AGAR|nr:hypothetical protein DFH08DRAFT_951113 [Mycena albidolilacea]
MAYEQVLDDLLELLTLPALRSLKITSQAASNIANDIFLPFLSRSPYLHKFFLHGPALAVETIRAMTRLTHLELWNTPGWLKDDLFQMLDHAHEPDTFPDL